VSERQGIEIDYCPDCRGIWLDRGELDKLIELAAQAQPAATATQEVLAQRLLRLSAGPYSHRKRGINMNGIALGLAVFAATVLYVAYIEFRAENRRDANLLAGFGGSGALVSAGLYLL
jgi:Zn-finger nucleic acid-binding protein